MDQPQFVDKIEGLFTIPQGENDTEGTASQVGYAYGHAPHCDFYNDDCLNDGILWGVFDMGSPSFCANHFFPQEQLGYEFIAESEK